MKYRIDSPSFSLRNQLFNGNLDIWQRGTSLAVTTGQIKYLADRWAISLGGTLTASTYSRQTISPIGSTPIPFEPKFFLRNVITNGGDSSGGYAILSQKIENIRDSSGITKSISFWAKADTTRSISVSIYQHFGTGGSPSTSVRTFVKKLSLTTSWQLFVMNIAVPSIAGKTIGTDGDETSYLSLEIWQSAGFIYDAVTGTLGIQTGTFDFAQFQLEEGSVVTPFEKRPFGLELSLCQRSFEKSYLPSVNPGTASAVGFLTHAGSTDAVGNALAIAPYLVDKRIVPTLTIYSYGGTINATTAARSGSSGEVSTTNYGPGTHHLSFYGAFGAFPWVTCWQQYHFTADAEYYY